MSKRDFNKERHRGKATERHEPKPKPKPKGAWTHVKRAPVRTFTDEEKAAWASTTGAQQ